MARCTVVQGRVQINDAANFHPNTSIHEFFGLANNKPSGQSINAA